MYPGSQQLAVSKLCADKRRESGQDRQANGEFGNEHAYNDGRTAAHIDWHTAAHVDGRCVYNGRNRSTTFGPHVYDWIIRCTSL